MTWSESYVVASTLVAGMQSNGSRPNLDLTATSTQWYVALFDNTVTPNPDTDPQYYGTAPWNSGEVTGTNWPAGGVALSLTGGGLTHATGGILKFTAAAVNVATTTIAAPGAFGALIYNQALTPHYVLGAVWFGGNGFTTAATPFSITWPAGGIFTLSMVP